MSGILRVGVNATVFKNPTTGVAKRLIFLMIELCKLNPKIHYFLFSPQDFSLSDSLQHLTITRVISPVSLLNFNEWSWKNLNLPKLLIKYKIDIFEAPWGGGIPYPNFITRKLFSHPIYKRIQFIFTLHDLIPLKTHSFFLTRWHFKKNLRQQLTITNHIVVVSVATKKELLSFCEKNISCECQTSIKRKIILSPNGYDPNLFYATKKTTSAIDTIPQKLKQKLTLLLHSSVDIPPFLFYIGGFNPRKNLLPLIKGVKNRLLILAGKENNYYKKVLAPEIKKVNQNNTSIVSLGYVDEKDLPWLYQHCELFVYPSLLEGFGMPVIEALACGATVITQKNTLANFPNLQPHLNNPTETLPQIAKRLMTVLGNTNSVTINLNQKSPLTREANRTLRHEYTWESISKYYYQHYKKQK